MSVEGCKYWVQVVDDATHIGFCYFMKLCSNIEDGLFRVVSGICKYGYKVSFIQYNNAGENNRQITDFADHEGILMEQIAPFTPQYNGVVERRIAVLKDMSRAMMHAADLS